MTCDVNDMAVKMMFFYIIIMLRLAISYPVLLFPAVLVDTAAGVYALHYYWCYNIQQTVVSPLFFFRQKIHRINHGPNPCFFHCMSRHDSWAVLRLWLCPQQFHNHDTSIIKGIITVTVEHGVGSNTR
jgi:hypothetical protein